MAVIYRRNLWGAIRAGFPDASQFFSEEVKANGHRFKLGNDDPGGSLVHRECSDLQIGPLEWVLLYFL